MRCRSFIEDHEVSEDVFLELFRENLKLGGKWDQDFARREGSAVEWDVEKVNEVNELSK